MTIVRIRYGKRNDVQFVPWSDSNSHALRYLILSFLMLFCVYAHTQETHVSEHEPVHHVHHHQILVGLGHTHIASGVDQDGNKKWLALPSWVVNYNYLFDSQWSLGLHTDIILEDFVVKHDGEEELERSTPVTMSLMGGYKFWGPFRAIAGGGIEWASEETFEILRVGIEPGWEFGEGKWEVSVAAVMEFKLRAYNSFTISIGVSRMF